MDKLRDFLQADGVFYATFYESEREADNPNEPHDHGHFAYTRDQILDFGTRNGWTSEYIGDWDHPRGQVMVRYRPRG